MRRRRGENLLSPPAPSLSAHAHSMLTLEKRSDWPETHSCSFWKTGRRCLERPLPAVPVLLPFLEASLPCPVLRRPGSGRRISIGHFLCWVGAPRCSVQVMGNECSLIGLSPQVYPLQTLPVPLRFLTVHMHEPVELMETSKE